MGGLSEQEGSRKYRRFSGLQALEINASSVHPDSNEVSMYLAEARIVAPAKMLPIKPNAEILRVAQDDTSGTIYLLQTITRNAQLVFSRPPRA